MFQQILTKPLNKKNLAQLSKSLHYKLIPVCPDDPDPRGGAAVRGRLPQGGPGLQPHPHQGAQGARHARQVRDTDRPVRQGVRLHFHTGSNKLFKI